MTVFKKPEPKPPVQVQKIDPRPPHARVDKDARVMRYLMVAAGVICAAIAAYILGHSEWFARRAVEAQVEKTAPVVAKAAPQAPPKSWTLWGISESGLTKEADGDYSAELLYERQMEADLDRGTCESMRRGTIDDAERDVRGYFQYMRSSNGVTYHVRGKMQSKEYKCLPAGEQPKHFARQR